MKWLLAILCLLSVSAWSAATPTPVYQFTGDSFSTSTDVEDSSIGNSSEGYFVKEPSSGGAMTADIQVAPWTSNAMRIVNAGVWRGGVGNTKTVYYSANNLTLSARAGSTAGGGDRHALMLGYTGPSTDEPHPANGYVYQYRSAINEARITKWHGTETGNGKMYEILAIATHTVSDESDFQMECFQGENGDLTLTLDGTPVVVTNDTLNQSGGWGWYGYGTTDTFLDDIEIRQSQNIVPTPTAVATALPCPPNVYCENFETYVEGTSIETPGWTVNGSTAARVEPMVSWVNQGVYTTGSSWASIYNGAVSTTDGKFTARTNSNRIYICMRVSGAVNSGGTEHFKDGYCLEVSHANTRWRLLKGDGSNMATELASNTSFFPANLNDYTIGISCDGTTIKGFVDGVEVASVTDASFAGPNEIGFIFYNALEKGEVDELVLDNRTPVPTYTPTITPTPEPSTDTKRGFDLKLFLDLK